MQISVLRIYSKYGTARYEYFGCGEGKTVKMCFLKLHKCRDMLTEWYWQHPTPRLHNAYYLDTVRQWVILQVFKERNSMDRLNFSASSTFMY